MARDKAHPFAPQCLAFLLLYAFAAITLLSPAESKAASPVPITLVAFGDSLTAGYGLAPEHALPRQLEKALRARGKNVRVINAGVSGDTTAAGLARLDWAVPKETDAVILELGANDALRGLPPDKARANLDAILARLKQQNIPVLLAGMIAPRNMGHEYASRFDALYPALAEKYDIPLYPFFLEGIAGERKLNLPDGLHPNPGGVAIIVERILPAVERLVEQARPGGKHAGR